MPRGRVLTKGKIRWGQLDSACVGVGVRRRLALFPFLRASFGLLATDLADDPVLTYW